MKKGTVIFPVFTSRQTSTNLPPKPNQTARLKSKESSSLLKLMKEDIKRVKQSRAGKFDKTDISQIHRQNTGQKNTLKGIHNYSSNKKGQRMPSLQIYKIAKTQTYRTIIPQVTKTQGTGRKATAVSTEPKQNSMNMKLSGEKVIVANQRKEFSKINQELIFERRQNYLNSKFVDRVNRLNVITQQNKKIYDRINSQRSHYSNDQLNKSYESNASISKRLSNSKISRRSRLSMSSQRSVSSSRCSLASKKSAKSIKYHEGFHSKQALKNKAAPKRLIKIESKSINELKVEQFQNFATLFASTNNNMHLENKRMQSRTARKHNESYQFKENIETVVESRQKTQIKLQGKQCRLPSLGRCSKITQNHENAQKSSKQRVSSIRKRILSTIDQNAVGISLNLCNNLHKIMEEASVPVRKILNPNLKR